MRLETVERWREVTGELRAVRRSTVAAEHAGQVVELAIEPGDAVEAGAVLAQLDDALARLFVDQARAAIRTREALVVERNATLDKTRRDLARIEDSYARAGAAQLELDDARTNLANADARLAQSQADLAWAQADLRLAEKRLADMTVKAPFAGVIIAKRTEVGQWVKEGDTVIELVALDALDAWLDVPEDYMARLLPRADADASAAEVVVRVPALLAAGVESELRAAVSSVIPEADPLSRLFPVRVRLPNRATGAATDGPLRPGMTVVGLIPTGEARQALTVSKDAVVRAEAGMVVYYDAGGVVGIAPVRVEHAVGNRVVVQSPQLQPGTLVVIEGNERGMLFPGQPLMIQNPPAPAEPAAR